MGIIHTLNKALIAADDDYVCASQSPAGAGNLLINGPETVSGVATFDTQRRVLFTFAADESNHTFVVYGTNQSGSSIQETVLGTTPGTVATNQDFLTVTRISIDHASTGALTVGTNGVGSTDWQSVDLMRQPVNIGFQVDVSGTVNYTVEATNTDIQNLAPGAYATAWAHVTVASQAVGQSAAWTDSIAYFRLTINSGTGTCALTYSQAGP